MITTPAWLSMVPSTTPLSSAKHFMLQKPFVSIVRDAGSVHDLVPWQSFTLSEVISPSSLMVVPLFALSNNGRSLALKRIFASALTPALQSVENSLSNHLDAPHVAIPAAMPAAG